MKKLKVLISYHDTQFGRRLSVGEIYEVDSERAKVIVATTDKQGNPIAQIIEDKPDPKDFDLKPPHKTAEEFHSESEVVDTKLASDLGELPKKTPKRRYGKHRKTK